LRTRIAFTDGKSALRGFKLSIAVFSFIVVRKRAASASCSAPHADETMPIPIMNATPTAPVAGGAERGNRALAATRIADNIRNVEAHGSWAVEAEISNS
jgi:hypothetical protein